MLGILITTYINKSKMKLYLKIKYNAVNVTNNGHCNSEPPVIRTNYFGRILHFFM
jgi:hypothetical protein